MSRRFLADVSGASAVEYIVVAALALGLLGTIIWALMDTVRAKGEAARSSLESQIPTPPP